MKPFRWLRKNWQDIGLCIVSLLTGLLIGVGGTILYFREKPLTCYTFAFSYCNEYSQTAWYVGIPSETHQLAREVGEEMIKKAWEKGDYVLTSKPLVYKCNCEEK